MELLLALYAVAAPLWTLLVIAIFVGIFIWAYWPRNRAQFDSYARIPLDGDE